LSDLTLLADGATLDRPAPDDAPQPPPPDDGAAPATPAEASDQGDGAESTKTEDWRAAFADASDPRDLFQRAARTLSREEMLRDPTIAGILGDAADKLERRRSAEREREAEATRQREAEAARERELDELVENEDILSLGERALEERRMLREQRTADEAQRQRQGEVSEAFQSRATDVLNRFVDAQDAAIRAKLQELARSRGEAYQLAGDWDDGYRMWLADMVGVHTEAARQNWERTTRQALRQELLGEIESGEAGASPEIGSGSGGAAGGQVVTQAEWDANRRDTSWRRANHDRIMRAVADGRIRE